MAELIIDAIMGIVHISGRMTIMIFRQLGFLVKGIQIKNRSPVIVKQAPDGRWREFEYANGRRVRISKNNNDGVVDIYFGYGKNKRDDTDWQKHVHAQVDVNGKVVWLRREGIFSERDINTLIRR